MEIFQPLIFLTICINWMDCASSNRRHKPNTEAAHETLRLCPRNLENIDSGYRRCLRPCITDADCKGRKKKCLCDGDCGMSCIKQNTKCAPLVDPLNGKVHTTGIEAFGAKVFYTCQPDFKLKGPRSRSCQGDATWSGDMPICQPDVKCEDPPEVPHAQHNADWRHHTYDLDTMIQYTCESGYAIEGFARAKCIYFNGTAKWFGPDLRCVPRDCGHPADIANGYREGDLFYYPHRVKFHCYPGYNLIGKPIRHCQRNGKWDGENPLCKAVECARPADPYNGFAIITSLKYESTVIYTCKPGYQLVKSEERRCLANQTWSGPEPKCEVINCGPPPPINNGGYNGSSTTYNSVIFYFCNKGMKFGGTANSAKCQADGKWSHAPPKCYASCIIPYIENGNANGSPGEYISHGDVLNVSCLSKYELAYSTISPKCFNGSLLHIPTCQPASCKTPPPSPRQGFVIAPKTDHGMKARFACNKGYRIVGGDTVMCDYGNWTGEAPICQEVYCPWPGKLGNGTVYLVGAMGSYEYYSYIKTVVQDRQIRYECSKGYFLHGGPAGATCIDGSWSPREMPKCYPGLHPPQSLFGPRVKRTVPKGVQPMWRNFLVAPCSGLISENFEQSNLLRDPDDAAHFTAVVRCRAGFTPNVPNGAADCRNGTWKPRKPDCVPLTCRVPETMNGQFVLLPGNQTVAAWTELVDSAVIDFSCIAGYKITGPEQLHCSAGQFVPPTIPECIPASCHLSDIAHGSYNGGYRSGLQVSHNSIIGFHCADGYRKSPTTVVRCDLGRLTPRAPECIGQYQEVAVPAALVENAECEADGNKYRSGSELEIPCYPKGHSLHNVTHQHKIIKCLDGLWVERKSLCDEKNEKNITRDPAGCAIPDSIPHMYAYNGNQRINLGKVNAVFPRVFDEKTELLFHCEHLGIFRLSGPPRTSCMDGTWNNGIPQCESLITKEPQLHATPAILYRKTAGIIGISKNGELIVYPSTDVQFDCLWKRTDGTPSWMVSHQFRIYPKGWATGPEDDRDKQYRLSIYHAAKDDSGIFTCMTPKGNSNSISIKVQVVECPLIVPFVYKLVANTSSTRMGTHASFNCSRGYRLDGPSHLECLPTGNWSNRIPTCIPIMCPMITTTDQKLRIYSTSNDIHSLAEFACPPGYRLLGSSAAKCNENGKWTNDSPTCEEILCPDPPAPEHGSVIKENRRYAVGNVIEYSCDSGYALLGTHIAVCTDSGHWSVEPQCTPSCNYPGHLSNGRISAPWILKFHYNIGEQIGFECSTQFVLNGNQNITCLSDGRWSSEMPVCLQKSQ
ncbi:sushi, von Willebrand factor type A, EGF and pentraxin domain-containing protein 1-like isoform X2 [Paramacrobiotus metropolitanus]|uniref:sushi, von Willebrand factor type A, EGF and pentraxin domain-containing protein 1-like isoform X2 n=1 Tax=Paramacrobiotus metropolitanus TaxID=2943436 RepID=UPI002445DEF4|nr:sushi, von Willebrand factor type A, EGF and pentraxin domain-containing protein 1-like isoform X2 [Paramacrobiotus metropolitanus]